MIVEHRRPKHNFDRNKFIMALSIFVAFTLIVRLFYLQVLEGNYYQTLAAKEHSGYTELPARRGEIMLQDYHSKETFKVATNMTLDTIYADPTLIKNPDIVAKTLSDLLFDKDIARQSETKRIEEESKKLDPNITFEEKQKLLTPKTDDELKQNYYNETLEKISTKTRQKIIITQSLDNKTTEAISLESLPGIEINNNVLIAYPTQISDIAHVAEILAKHLATSEDDLLQILKGKNRYVILKKKIGPEISMKIKELKKNDKNKDYNGVGLQPEYYRYYPENTLASSVTGFLDTRNLGEYGIEEKFDTLLRGEKGVFKTQKDSMGRQITVGESVIQPAVDGDDIVLTIDRSIQMEAEKLVRQGVKNYNADAGEIIVMEPSTGKVLAMAQFPTFDPNKYGDAFKKEPLNLNTDEIKNLIPIEGAENSFWLYIDREKGNRIQVFKETYPNNEVIYTRFANLVGPEVYKNKSVMEGYEPGSVFKPIAMSAAIDDGEVTPNTTFVDSGPIKVDIYEIKNATNQYYGVINMVTILEKSLNTGMAFIAKKIGRTLFYSYIKKFGFGEKTDIELPSEDPGQVAHFSGWADSELITHAFGQGLTTTPLQMISSYCAIANKGIRMKPYVIDKIIKKNGQVVKTDPRPINQSITEKTAQTLTAMLTSAVENGVARNGQVQGYYLAGKTGTAQTYFKGKPLNGTGTTIATMIGFGPTDKPKFAILVKFDKPRSSEWADVTASPIFSKMSQFLLNYFNVQKDKK
ncbi:MAG: stage V sporulation protein D, stage V sporulation protein D (sporulation-specific penicillin-binding protein) [Candidatus Peregrinibacteria bacterium GW2011_GWF2_38_29]|nr:MAG: stage V sporulation protein D, stage V sporulation protein D (sporulation-specific penicillin-binding protein) [Candidatus Peregrinibacteria bacterium GW2011_GWF2_38_29]HBB03134.1 hypothetical protein [Candidatus Peregrinibacteria bacterium]